jgi:hypothetical protein
MLLFPSKEQGTLNGKIPGLAILMTSGKGFRSEKLTPCGVAGHRYWGLTRSIWSKIDNGRKVPHWKACDSGNAPTSKLINF